MLPKNWGEPMGAPAIFEKQIETDSGFTLTLVDHLIGLNDQALNPSATDCPSTATSAPYSTTVCRSGATAITSTTTTATSPKSNAARTKPSFNSSPIIPNPCFHNGAVRKPLTPLCFPKISMNL
ncbi:MAG: hypothetical protein P8X79_18130 [Reinekea sp.]